MDCGLIAASSTMKRVYSLATFLAIGTLLLGGIAASAQESVLEADGMTIYGQRELPKVMYIVPWKKTKSAEIDMPMTESLVVDVLDPIDPDVFRRKIKYYEMMNTSQE